MDKLPSPESLQLAAADLYEALVLMVDMFTTTDQRYTGRVPQEAQRRYEIALAAIKKAETN